MRRIKRPRPSFWSHFHGILHTSTFTEIHSRRRRLALPLSLESLEDRTLLSAPPVLSVPSTSFDVVKTTTLSVTVSATDKTSGQILTFSLSGAPAGASITSTQVSTTSGSAATGVLSWTPTEDQGPAAFPFTITVTNSDNKSASQAITVHTDAVGLVGNNLLIVGTSINQGTATNPGNDVVSVNATTAANVISATVNGATSGPFTVPTGGQIIANLYGGDDSFTVNEGTQPVGPNVVVDGGTGHNTLIVNGTPGSDAFTITSTTVSLAGAGNINYSNFQVLAVNGLGGNDTFAMTGINPTTATTLDGGAGVNSFTGNFAQGFNGALTLANQQNATMQVTGNFTGSLTVNSPGSLQQLSVTGTVTAHSIITATNISNVSLGTLAGQLTASGGSLSGVNLNSIAPGGLLQATESAGVPGSGLISNATIGVNSGSISAGSISGMSVTTNAPGASIKVAGQGTTNNLSVGTNTGTITAVEDSNAGSGVMSNTTIGSNSGTVSSGSISGMSVTTNSGSITAAGQGTTNNLSVGTNTGTITAVEDTTSGSGVMSNTTIGSNSGTVSSGSISGMSVTTNSGSITAAGAGTITNLTVGTNSGLVKAKADTASGSGALSSSSIGTLTTSGIVSAATGSNLTITTVAGTIQITNALSNLTAGTVASTANLSAGHFNIMTAQHAASTVHFVEPTVTRTLTVTPHGGSAVPDYGFYYDGTASGDPRVVVQVVGGSTPPGFDLGVTTSTATNGGKGFDLAGLYSVDSLGNHNVLTGIHNVEVGGDLLLGAVPAGAISFFSLPSNTAGGVQLPQDTVAVAVAGNAPAASIVAKAVPALAAGSFAGVSADNANHTNALAPLAAGTALTQANDTFQVFVSEASHVAQFLVTGPGGSFDNNQMLFADQVADNSPVTATDKLVPSGSSTTVSTVVFTGQGGSLTTAQPITTSISATPGGSLGDLILSAPHGITANITADSIIGNINATNGGISGIIQTTGNLGRTITDANGTITGVTFIDAGGGGLTGQIIVGGNLISQVNVQSGLDGVVAVQGDIGAIQTSGGVAVTGANGALSRFGGITVSTGGVDGQIVAIGNVFGDINVTGGLGGRIAAKGHEEFGLSTGKNFSRTGILGNVSIGGGIGTTGAIISAGLLGDDGTDLDTDVNSPGTHLSISGTDKGILAAEEDINFGATGSLNQAGLFENVGSPSSSKYANGVNKAAIDAIFTNNSGQLLTIPGDLSTLLAHLAALHVATNGNLSDVPGT
jgi:hypothetical protein